MSTRPSLYDFPSESRLERLAWWLLGNVVMAVSVVAGVVAAARRAAA